MNSQQALKNVIYTKQPVLNGGFKDNIQQIRLRFGMPNLIN